MKQLKTPELAKDISRVKIDFALQLNNLMIEKNISQKELSEKTGKSKSLISRILCGDNNLTMETMVELYHALDEVLIISTQKIIINNAFMLLTRKYNHVHHSTSKTANISNANISRFITSSDKSQGIKNDAILQLLKKSNKTQQAIVSINKNR